jgi:hypothetical protein
MIAITISNRTFVALHKAGPRKPGRAPVYHAVTPQCRMALCAAEPGASTGWAEPPAAHVTCPECLRRLARLRSRDLAGQAVRQRHGHMIELLQKGVVPLVDSAQIDGLLDAEKPPARLGVLRRIEDACRKRKDDVALATIAKWRLQRQNR